MSIHSVSTNMADLDEIRVEFKTPLGNRITVLMDQTGVEFWPAGSSDARFWFLHSHIRFLAEASKQLRQPDKE